LNNNILLSTPLKYKLFQLERNLKHLNNVFH